MARSFVAVWLLYWLAIALLPVHSIYPGTFVAVMLQLEFVVIVLTGIAITRLLVGERALPRPDCYEIPTANKLIQIALWMSVIGTLCLIYDKVFVQGIDYSNGIAVAREEWRQLGEDRDGNASSIFSMLGYFFGSAYYVAIVLAVTQIGVVSPKLRMKSLLVAFVLLMINSAITGGRSNLLLVAVFVLAAFGARKGLALFNVIPRESQRLPIKPALLLGFALLLGLAYAVMIFYQRAEAGESDALNYAIEFLPFLGLEASDEYLGWLDDSAISSLSAMLVLTISYVTHSFATVAAIVDSNPENKTILFLHLAGIASKLGLIAPPDGDWFLAGRFPSVPGSLLYQFGWLGFICGSLILGMLSEFCRSWASKRPDRLMPLGSYVMAHATLLLTPALFAVDLLSFPFVFGSFVQLAVINHFLRLNRGNTELNQIRH
jgi:oligosaccharide repeat unit polymerase